MPRPKLPDSKLKVRVVIYAKPENLSAAKAYARNRRALSLSEFVDRVFAETRRLQCPENKNAIQT